MGRSTDAPRPWLGLLAAALVLLGCAPSNRLGQPVAIERVGYEYAGEALDFFVARPPADAGLPVLVFLEGDGGQCQEFSLGLWRRFLVRYVGRFLLVRARTLVNAACDGPRWQELDFLHRLDELAILLAAVRCEVGADRPVVLLGHSAGAHVARLYAERHPDEVAGLVNLSGGYDELSAVLRELASDDERGRELRAFLARLPTRPDDEPVWGRTARFWKQMAVSGVRELWLTYGEPCLVLDQAESRP